MIASQPAPLSFALHIATGGSICDADDPIRLNRNPAATASSKSVLFVQHGIFRLSYSVSTDLPDAVFEMSGISGPRGYARPGTRAHTL